MDIYAENILDHYRHPRNKKALGDATVSHTEVNASCGDSLALQLRMTDGRLTDLGWSGEGCAISQAAASLLSEEMLGRTEEELAALAPQDVYDLLGVPVGPRRFKCALLPLHTLHNALLALHGEAPQPWRKTVGEG